MPPGAVAEIVHDVGSECDISNLTTILFTKIVLGYVIERVVSCPMGVIKYL